MTLTRRTDPTPHPRGGETHRAHTPAARQAAGGRERSGEEERGARTKKKPVRLPFRMLVKVTMPNIPP